MSGVRSVKRKGSMSVGLSGELCSRSGATDQQCRGMTHWLLIMQVQENEL